MKTLSESSVTIVGLGLMGGSLAMALRPHVAELGGVDIDIQTLVEASKQGIVDWTRDSIQGEKIQSDVIILATPVRSIIKILHELPELLPGGCSVLDLGSTKTAIVEAMSKMPSRFEALGGHPMCGREVSGILAASDDLYHDKPFVLCPNERTTPEIESKALQIINVIGAKSIFMEAEIHDRLVAASSHLPYLLSSLLMRRASAIGIKDERLWSVVASGFRDTTRLSGSNPGMMADILLTNKANLIDEITQYTQLLDEMKLLLSANDDTTITDWLNSVYQEYTSYKNR